MYSEATIAAVLAAVALILREQGKAAAAAPARPPAPAAAPLSMLARVRAAIRVYEPRELQAGFIEAIGRVETDDFTSDALKQTNSFTSRHAGSGRGYWTGNTYVTAANEELRIYVSLEQCAQDFVQSLLQDGLYKTAKLYYEAGQSDKFFAAIVYGDGRQGYVGNPKSQKALNYETALKRRYRQVVSS